MAQQYQVVIATEARNELRKALDYVRRNSSLQQAQYVNAKIQESVAELRTLPERHRRLEYIGSDQRVYRTLPKWSFLERV